MKKLFTLSVIIALNISVFAQSPQKMSYQAVVRNAIGVLQANQAVGMKISILQGSETGPAVYVETQTKTTNANGLVTLEIGSGTIVSGTFSGIDWSNGTYFIKTETDPTGGTSYSITGTSQILSVPYALYAKTAKTANYNDLTNKPTTLSGYGITDAVTKSGTQTITGTTTFKGTTPDMEESLFDVKNKDGQTIFAVYNEGVRIWVADGAKGSKGRFVVGGFDMIQNYLDISADSARIYVKNPAKGVNGGFTVGGFDNTGGTVTPFTSLTPENYFIGHKAGFSNTTGMYNSFIGYKAGYSNTEGLQNSFLGYYSGYSNTTGYSNIFIGDSSGFYNTTGRYNVFIGNGTGLENTSGFQNIYLGEWAGGSNTTGNRNIIIGTAAGWQNTEGFNNVFIGNYAGAANTIGNLNVIIGRAAGYRNTEGIGNTFLGEGAGWGNTTGNKNVYVGLDAGRNSDGYSNVFIGTSAGYNEKGSNKLYIENSAADSNGSLIYGEFDNKKLLLNADVTIHGGLKFFSGSANIFLGDSAGYYNTTGDMNTVLGYWSGGENTTGGKNVFLGTYAGGSNTVGNRNVFVGSSSGINNTDGNENTSLGAAALYTNQTGSYNTVLGRSAGFSNLAGERNVFLGYKAGYNELGSDKLYIENSDANPNNVLIYGEFNNDYLKLNALTSVRDALILEPRSSAPASPVKGMMYFDSTDNKLKVFDGTIWRSLW